MAEILITSVTPTEVKTAITKGLYDMLFYDRSGIQSTDAICQNAINSAFSTVSAKAVKSEIDLSDITQAEYDQVKTAFLYLVESEGHGYNLNEGSYKNKRNQALRLLTDLWGSSASDTPIDNATQGGFIDATVAPIVYTTKEDRLFNNDLFN